MMESQVHLITIYVRRKICKHSLTVLGNKKNGNLQNQDFPHLEDLSNPLYHNILFNIFLIVWVLIKYLLSHLL